MGASRLGDVERPKIGNSVYKHPLRPQMVVMDPSDNLPRPAVISSMTDTAAPVLSPETLICMGDESVFVIRDDWGDAVIQVPASRVRRGRGGEFFAKLTQEETEKLDSACVSFLRGTGSWNTVEPLRTQCSFYRRVMTDFEGNAEHQQVERVCSAQRTESGEFTSLSDTRVFACEHRAPRDFVSEERLKRFDEKRIEEGKKSDEEWVPPTHGDQNG
jgi:hypothetical protein